MQGLDLPEMETKRRCSCWQSLGKRGQLVRAVWDNVARIRMDLPKSQRVKLGVVRSTWPRRELSNPPPCRYVSRLTKPTSSIITEQVALVFPVPICWVNAALLCPACVLPNSSCTLPPKEEIVNPSLPSPEIKRFTS